MFFLLNTLPTHVIHAAVTTQLKAWERNSGRKRWEQQSHRGPFSETIKPVSRDFYSRPLPDVQNLCFDYGTSDTTRYYSNLFLRAARDLLWKWRYLVILNRLPWIHSSFSSTPPSDSKCALCISSLRSQQIRWKGIFLPVLAWHIFIHSLTPP